MLKIRAEQVTRLSQHAEQVFVASAVALLKATHPSREEEMLRRVVRDSMALAARANIEQEGNVLALADLQIRHDVPAAIVARMLGEASESEDARVERVDAALSINTHVLTAITLDTDIDTVETRQ